MKVKLISFLALVGILLTACKNDKKQDLGRIEQQELAKGIRNDSLFMGFYFGMPKQDFFNYCWGMNKKGIFMEGEGMSVEYQLGKQDFNFPLQMNFYPHFENERIVEMPIRFTYKTLDPWNPNMQTDKLVADVRKLMIKWYGGDLFITNMPTGKKAYAQVSGNRRILIFVEKDFEVIVLLTDLAANKI